MCIFMLLTNILPEATCCCLQTCNVYGAWVTLYCICLQTFVVTCANIYMLVISTFSLFRNVLPEAICCRLQTCYVDIMLLLMDCVCLLTFIVVTLLVVLVTYTNSPLL